MANVDGTLSQTTYAALTPRLSILMFMQFFVWGAWNVTLGLVMQTHGLGAEIGNAFSVGPIASIAGSFLLGMAATRYLSPRLLMALLHLLVRLYEVACDLLFLLIQQCYPDPAQWIALRAARTLQVLAAVAGAVNIDHADHPRSAEVHLQPRARLFRRARQLG